MPYSVNDSLHIHTAEYGSHWHTHKKHTLPEACSLHAIFGKQISQPLNVRVPLLLSHQFEKTESRDLRGEMLTGRMAQWGLSGRKMKGWEEGMGLIGIGPGEWWSRIWASVKGNGSVYHHRGGSLHLPAYHTEPVLHTRRFLWSPNCVSVWNTITSCEQFII